MSDATAITSPSLTELRDALRRVIECIEACPVQRISVEYTGPFSWYRVTVSDVEYGRRHVTAECTTPHFDATKPLLIQLRDAEAWLSREVAGV